MTESDKIKMFEEIERLSNLFHSEVCEIKNADLLNLLRENHHICMCGKMIFTSFLPKEIQNEYSEWHFNKSMNEITNNGVEEIRKTVDKKILEEVMKTPSTENRKECTDCEFFFHCQKYDSMSEEERENYNALDCENFSDLIQQWGYTR